MSNAKAVQINRSEPEVDPRYVVSDAEFITRTRTLSIHDPDAKKWFFANGGLDIFEDYTTLAQAFDSLRRAKMSRLAGIKNSKVKSETRIANQDVKIYVVGTVADAQQIREKALETQRQRRDNDQWLRTGIQRRTA